MSTRFVLFSGYNERAIIALCRELRAIRAPYSIIASGDHDPIFRTRYRADVAAVRRARALDATDIDRCLQRLKALHPADRYVIAPSSEFLNQHVLTHRAWFAERGFAIPLVDAETYARVTNKSTFRELCMASGIGVPARVDITTATFPFVAKPRVNINALGRSLYPALIYTPDDWAAQRDGLGDLGDYYFEELVDGASYYLLYYIPADPTTRVFAWSQRNLLQQPNGKSMVLALSDTIHTEPISARVVSMLRGVGFHGLAMVEVIRRRDDYVAIELNPRLWGPMQLLRNSGSQLIRAFLEDTIDGAITHADPDAGHAAAYVWLGGLRPGMTWHSQQPRHPWLSLTAHIVDDVYFRPDTVGLFIDECVRRHP